MRLVATVLDSAVLDFPGGPGNTQYFLSCLVAVICFTVNLENSAVATGLEKVSFHPDPKERQCQRMLKLPHNCTHLTQQQSNAQNSPSPGFNNTWTENFQMFKLHLEKAEEPEIKLPTSTGSQKKLENSRKTSTPAVLTTPKPLTVWFTMNYGKFLKRWEYQNTSLVS